MKNVGQIIQCKIQVITCPTISQKRRTGYAPPFGGRVKIFHEIFTSFIYSKKLIYNRQLTIFYKIQIGIYGITIGIYVLNPVHN